MKKDPDDILTENFDDLDSFEDSVSREPMHMDAGTFKQRNDPQELLFRFKLSLMQAFMKKETVKDAETGKETVKTKIIKKQNVDPLANKIGQEELPSYLENYINSHVVQGNIDNKEEYNNRLKYMSNNLTTHFMAKRQQWGIKLRNIDLIICRAIDIIDLFLTRTLFNKEREGYNEGYKETTTKEIKPQVKPNIFQRMGGFISEKM